VDAATETSFHIPASSSQRPQLGGTLAGLLLSLLLAAHDQTISEPDASIIAQLSGFDAILGDQSNLLTSQSPFRSLPKLSDIYGRKKMVFLAGRLSSSRHRLCAARRAISIFCHPTG